MFQVGDEVCCVDDVFNVSVSPLRHGRHYIVRWIGPAISPHYGTPFDGVRLVGVTLDSSAGAKDMPIWADRFRPVHRESVELFRAMCASTRPLVPVE